MKPVELRKKSAGELADLLRERQVRREELVLLLGQHKAKNVKELATVRRDIARIKTILAQQPRS
ncbi:50S ribosomal protein L29 [Candidatus Parcubacteria bacterium]|nr:MAG: 50S ribosomal protein L29 [Candidatus Parcubacteria bacterium]